MPTPNTPLRSTFKKTERLCSKKRIEQLFGAGNKSLTAYPLRAICMTEEREGMPVEVLISISKRHLKRAVDRNRIKRLIREAYRRHKYIVWNALGQKRIALAFLWTSNEIASYPVVEQKVQNLLQRIAEKL